MAVSFKRNLVSLAVGAGFGQVVVAIATLLTARTFGTTAFGALGLVVSLGSPGAILLGRRYELGLPSYADAGDAGAILRHLRIVSLLAMAVSVVWAFAWIRWGPGTSSSVVAAIAPAGIALSLIHI